MVDHILKWQAAALGMFTAIGAAAIGMLDHVADADQSYRLMAMHMFIGKDAARQLTMATDALGVSLNDAIWDPELRKRFDGMIEDQKRMSAALGVNYDDQMRYIRDLKGEYQRFTIEAQYVMMALAPKLLAALTGGKEGDLLQTLQGWNDWIITHIPQITEWVSGHLTPVWNDFKDVARETWGLIKEIAVAFTNLIGLISGDHSIEGTEFSFKKTATAIGEALHMMAAFIKAVIHAEEVVLHLVSAAAMMGSGNFKGAMAELRLAGQNITPGSAAVGGAVAGGSAGAVAGPAAGALLGAATGPAAPIMVPLLMGLGAAVGPPIGAAFGGTIGWGFGKLKDSIYGPDAAAGGGTEGPGGTAAAGGSGLERLAHAIGYAEGFGIAGAKPTRNHNMGDLTDASGNIRSFETDAQGHDALIAQLQLIVSGKSKAYGAKDLTLEEFGKKYTSTDQAAWLENVMKASGYSKDTKLSAIAAGTAPTIGSITVNVAGTNASPAEIHRAVAAGTHQALKDQQERNMAEAQGAYAGAY